ncbi:hypothetical protein BDV93DRAFT_125854 [Ceratobasidium sp. AG-I]|nr:hypothetical protein BDV93DRAFT_125854 [Ceratobasidium sp. AG-I]
MVGNGGFRLPLRRSQLVLQLAAHTGRGPSCSPLSFPSLAPYFCFWPRCLSCVYVHSVELAAVARGQCAPAGGLPSKKINIRLTPNTIPPGLPSPNPKSQRLYPPTPASAHCENAEVLNFRLPEIGTWFGNFFLG